MSSLTSLPNVGVVLEKNLNAIGIFTPEELIRIGSKEAFLRIKLIDHNACLHMLYGLQGAIEGIRDTKLSQETKDGLREFYHTL